MKFFISSVLLLVCAASAVHAQQLYRRPAFLVRPEVSVRGEEILLKDIASFSRGEKGTETLLAALQAVKLGDAPAPKTKVTLLGAAVLEMIEATGISRESFGFSLPAAIVVEREGRAVKEDEVLEALKKTLWKNKNLDLQVRSVTWANEQIIPVGKTRVDVQPLGDTVSGKIPLRTEIYVDEKPVSRFLATAIADDWREVPVLGRVLERGMLISASDIQVVRVNLHDQPADAVANAEELVGKRAKARINPGEIVRKSTVDIPPTVPKGKKVTVYYRNGALTASVTATAIEDGFSGGTIQVRNDASKKIIVASVKNGDEVEVRSE